MAISKINTRALANDSVTTDKVADNAITTDMVASGEIGVTDLADGSITNAKISSTAAIAPSKIDMASVAALTMSGGLTIATGEAGLIATGTSDAADNKRITLAGGGSASWDRGSYLRVAGNESSTGGDLDLIAGNVSGADINMYTGGDISATLTNAGNFLVGANAVGMGTSSSVTGAAIRGSIGYFEIARDGSNPVRLNRQSSDGSIIDFAKDGSTVGSIGSSTNIVGALYIAGDSGLQFRSDDILPTNSSGVYSDGAVDLGDGGAKFRNLYLSGGVTFGDAGGSGTSTSNTLDSYERGDWTPVWQDSSGTDYNVSGYQNNVGQYVRVGDYVFCNLYIQHTGPLSGGTNWLRLSGLPFASVSTLANLTAGSIYNWGGFTGLGQGDQMIFRTQIGTNQGYFQVTNGGTGRNVTQNDFGGALSFACSFSYRAS